jgi:hypothetical protein
MTDEHDSLFNCQKNFLSYLKLFQKTKNLIVMSNVLIKQEAQMAI